MCPSKGQASLVCKNQEFHSIGEITREEVLPLSLFSLKEEKKDRPVVSEVADLIHQLATHFRVLLVPHGHLLRSPRR